MPSSKSSLSCPTAALERLERKIRKRRPRGRRPEEHKRELTPKELKPTKFEIRKVPKAPTADGLDSIEGLIQHLKHIVQSPKTKVQDQLRAVDQIAEIRGYKRSQNLSNLRHATNEELESLSSELALPVFIRFMLENMEAYAALYETDS